MKYLDEAVEIINTYKTESKMFQGMLSEEKERALELEQRVTELQNELCIAIMNLKNAKSCEYCANNECKNCEDNTCENCKTTNYCDNCVGGSSWQYYRVPMKKDALPVYAELMKVEDIVDEDLVW